MHIFYFVFFFQSVIGLNTEFFKKNCDEVLNFNAACPQLKWDYPICVPWHKVNCKLNRNKKKKYCINYDCSV